MIGSPFIILDEVDSSNNYAIELATQGLAQHGAAFLAKHQTAGKGQRGKVWKDASGKNIALSVLLDTKGLQPEAKVFLSIAMALAVQEFYSKYAIDNVCIKWPNDIYWCDRKAVGILIENKYLGKNWKWAVVGIGININQTEFEPSLFKKAVSLKQITGKEFNCELLAKELCTYIERRFEQVINGSFDTLLSEFNNILYKSRQFVDLKYNNEIYHCFIEKVNQLGQLEVKGAPKEAFNFGEVEWLIH